MYIYTVYIYILVWPSAPAQVCLAIRLPEPAPQ